MSLSPENYASELLPVEFLQQYQSRQPQWGFHGLGYIVYKRTYARQLPGTNQTEEWWQTVARCINGAQKIGANYTAAEAQRLYDLVFHLKCNFAGRMLWQLGTSTVDRFGANSLLNCWFTAMRLPEDFCFLFENLMLGGGVGFSVKREDVHELPKVRKHVKITHESTRDADFIVPDSREGWVQLLRNTLEAFFVTGRSFSYSTILVRGAGEPIQGFGGSASGPRILIEGIDKISNILSSRAGKKLRSLDVLDIANIIGSIVVAGNVRRCLPAGSQVLTDQGLRCIEQLQPGDQVQVSDTETRTVLNVFDQGLQQTWTITTQCGAQYRATAQHRFMTWDTVHQAFVWTQVQQLDVQRHRLVGPGFSQLPIQSIEPHGTEHTWDIEVQDLHYFFLADQHTQQQLVVSHNSAQVAIGDPDDFLFLRAKRWDLGNIPNWRAMSNNTVSADSYDQISNTVWEGYEGNGEPYGLFNLPLALKYGRLGEERRDVCEGGNPCMEIPLADKECCNLSELYLNNIESESELIECATLLYKTQKAICALPFIHDETSAVVHKNMRLGIGITGVCQSYHKLSWLDTAYRALRKLDRSWSRERGWPESIRLTTVKPSGTLSLLAGATPGVHPGFSRYFIRRIRMSSTDALVGMCRELNYAVEYVRNFDGTENRDTVVVSFPCEFSEQTVLAHDMTAVQQLELVKNMQSCWADNSVSVTVYYRREELPEIRTWMKNNYATSLKTVSFLLHSDHGFAQAPYEQIDQQRYEQLLRRVKPLTQLLITHDDTGFTDLECASGVCPVK